MRAMSGRAPRVFDAGHGSELAEQRRQLAVVRHAQPQAQAHAAGAALGIAVNARRRARFPARSGWSGPSAATCDRARAPRRRLRSRRPRRPTPPATRAAVARRPGAGTSRSRRDAPMTPRAAREVADDRLARQRLAAARELHQQVAHALDGEVRARLACAGARETDGANARARARRARVRVRAARGRPGAGRRRPARPARTRSSSLATLNCASTGARSAFAQAEALEFLVEQFPAGLQVARAVELVEPAAHLFARTRAGEEAVGLRPASRGAARRPCRSGSRRDRRCAARGRAARCGRRPWRRGSDGRPRCARGRRNRAASRPAAGRSPRRAGVST